LKTFGRVLLAVFGIIILCYIGIPSRLISINIDKDKLARFKKANHILIKAQLQAPHNSVVGLTQFLPFEYGRITSTQQVDELFPSLSYKDRNEIKSLFNDGDIIEIDMHEQSCISYKLKKSLQCYLINSSAETLYLIHNNNCDCSCEKKGHDSKDKRDIKNLGDGWFRVDIIEHREPFRG
jgi:hypothetical protein